MIIIKYIKIFIGEKRMKRVYNWNEIYAEVEKYRKQIH